MPPCNSPVTGPGTGRRMCELHFYVGGLRLALWDARSRALPWGVLHTPASLMLLFTPAVSHDTGPRPLHEPPQYLVHKPRSVPAVQPRGRGTPPVGTAILCSQPCCQKRHSKVTKGPAGEQRFTCTAPLKPGKLGKLRSSSRALTHGSSRNQVICLGG